VTVRELVKYHVAWQVPELIPEVTVQLSPAGLDVILPEPLLFVPTVVVCAFAGWTL
jgi:hypothetical protein